MRRYVYRTTKGPINEINPSYKFEYTNQIYENGKWKYANRYIGKLGARPIIWYASLDWAEQCAPNDYKISDMVEWDGIDEEEYKNEYKPFTENK